jgi:hypothetical protein
MMICFIKKVISQQFVGRDTYRIMAGIAGLRSKTLALTLA